MRSLSFLFSLLLLAACGTRGPLTLPPKPQTAAPAPAGAGDYGSKAPGESAR
ncbi:MAG: lipoprotein [Rhodocyclaceae bacterium]|nr:lipoprotein [Rhodocyclaceae bacterium]